jgi:uncharacterized protein YwqG
MASFPEINLQRVDDGKAVGTRIGGEPEWIQNPWSPDCCGTPMNFLAQIDTLDISAQFPDSALVYVFICPKCFQTASQLQCC